MSVPDYCSNEKLKTFINLALHDAFTHVDKIDDVVEAVLSFRVEDLYSGVRTVKAKAEFKVGEHERPYGGYAGIASSTLGTYVSRTILDASWVTETGETDVTFNE